MNKVGLISSKKFSLDKWNVFWARYQLSIQDGVIHKPRLKVQIPGTTTGLQIMAGQQTMFGQMLLRI